MCTPVSGTAHRGQVPSPGPSLLTTSTPEGRRSLSSCHTKILIFSGKGAFHNEEVHGKIGPGKRARYAELTVKAPEGESLQETLSGVPERDDGRQARRLRKAAASTGPNIR